MTLEITLSVATVDSAIDRLRLPSNSGVTNVVITFEGLDNRDLANEHRLFLSDEQILRVFQAMADNLKQLETLRLEWNIISARFFEQPPLLPMSVLEFLITHTGIRCLSLYRVKLAGDANAYRQLTAAVETNSSLKTVRVEFCAPAGSPNLDEVVQSLTRLPVLRDFELIGFQGDSTRGCTSQSLQLLGSSPPQLRSIKLWGGILQAEDPQAVANLARGLETSRSMTDLEIGLFQLDLMSANALAKLITSNTTLGRIWLDVNTGLETELVAPLTQAMKDNTVLQSFNIVSTINQVIPSDILQLFVEMVKNNCSLRHCTIRGCGTANNDNNNNNENDEAASSATVARAEIDFYLKLNRVGRKGLLADTKSRRQWMSTVICEADNTSVIYYLLNRNPTFISQCVKMGPTKRKHHEEGGDPVTPEELPPRKRQKLVPFVSP